MGENSVSPLEKIGILFSKRTFLYYSSHCWITRYKVQLRDFFDNHGTWIVKLYGNSRPRIVSSVYKDHEFKPVLFRRVIQYLPSTWVFFSLLSISISTPWFKKYLGQYRTTESLLGRNRRKNWSERWRFDALVLCYKSLLAENELPENLGQVSWFASGDAPNCIPGT